MKRRLPKSHCDACGSSDAKQIYEDEDGKQDSYCFSCNKSERLFVDTVTTNSRSFIKMKQSLSKEEVSTYPIRSSNNDRGISEETNAYFGVRVSVNEVSGEVDTVYYPEYIKGVLSGYKARKLPKDFEQPSIGSIKNCDFFGQHLCSPELGKKLIITEGEEDCLMISDVIFSRFKKRANVCSLLSGASSAKKDFEKNLKFLKQFDQIILAFDKDEAGEKAVLQTSLVSGIELQKLYLMDLSEKDACDVVKEGKANEILEQFKSPKKYRPDGIIEIKDLEDLYFNENEKQVVHYPRNWSIFNETTQGIRLGEMDTFTGGTGGGKTQLFREIIVHLLNSTNENIGCLFLEETVSETLRGLGGILLRKRIHLPEVRSTVPKEDLKQSWDQLRKNNRLVFMDSTTYDTALSSIKYMAEYKNCKYIVLDHVSLLLSDIAGQGNEREKLDFIMTKLRNLVVKHNFWLGIAVHLRKRGLESTSFEEGAVPTLDDLRGSGGLKQLSNSVYALQRNSINPPDALRDVVTLHVLKNRFSGKTGICDTLRFNQDTGRLEKISSKF